MQKLGRMTSIGPRGAPEKANSISGLTSIVAAHIKWGMLDIARIRSEDLAALAGARAASLSAPQVDGRIVFTHGFGIEGQLIFHWICERDLDIDVVTLDTGRLFPETYALWAETERRYGRRIRAIYPDRAALERLVAKQGIDGIYESKARAHGLLRRAQDASRSTARWRARRPGSPACAPTRMITGATPA